MTALPRKAVEAATKPDFATLLASAKLPESTINVCMRADLVADHEAADRQLELLLEKPNPRMADDGRGALRKQLLDLEEQMQTATYPFRLRAMPRPVFQAFKAKHQPRRKENGDFEERDAAIGVNTETIWEPMLRACLIDPVLDDDAWAKLLATLTDRQFDDLSWGAWMLNRGGIDVPFSRAASRVTGSSGTE